MIGKIKYMKNFIKNILGKCIGKVEFIVTITNVSGCVEKYTLDSMKNVESYVCGINSEAYWMVSEIEKIRRLNFNFNKEVIHTPLHFSLDTVTERDKCSGYEYNFLKINESLKNIKRKVW